MRVAAQSAEAFSGSVRLVSRHASREDRHTGGSARGSQGTGTVLYFLLAGRPGAAPRISRDPRPSWFVEDQALFMRSRLRIATFGIIFFFFALATFPQDSSSGQSANSETDPQVIHDFELGRDLRRAGKLDAAAAAYQRVLQRASGLAVAHLNLGLVRHDQHDYAASTQEFSRAASLDPSLRQAHLYLGIDAYLWGRYETASKALQDALKLEPNNAEALYWLGLAQAAKGDLRGAADSLETATKLNPKDHDGLYQLEEVYLQLWRATYERLVAANPESLRIHQVLAEGYVQSNRLEDAKREYAVVLKANPTLTGVHEALGDIARQQQQLAAATKEYRSELQLDPNSARVWYKLADVLVDSSDYSEASKAARSAVALQADFAPGYYVLGRLARQENHAADALANFQKALKLGLKGELEESSHYQLYRLLQATGHTTEAATHKQEYLHLQEARKQRALNIAERELKVEESGGSH